MSYSLQQNLGSSSNDYNTFGGTGTDKWIGSSFKASSSYTVTQIEAKFGISGGAPWPNPVTCYIYGDTSGHPGTLLATSTNTRTDTVVDSTYYAWQFAGQAVTNNTRYWVAFTPTPGVDANRAIWYGYSGDAGGTEGLYFSTDGSTWSVNYPVDSGASSIQSTMKIYITDASATVAQYQNALDAQRNAPGVVGINHWWT